VAAGSCSPTLGLLFAPLEQGVHCTGSSTDTDNCSPCFWKGLTVPGEIKKALGGRIRAARKARLNNMPLEEFGRQVASLIGRARAFSNVTVSNWETGRQEPSWEALVSIARLTQLPLRYFAGVGDLEDYPMTRWQEPQRLELDPPLRTLVGAVQRLESAQQRLVIRQIESLIEALHEEDLFPAASSPAAATGS